MGSADPSTPALASEPRTKGLQYAEKGGEDADGKDSSVGLWGSPLIMMSAVKEI